MSYILSYNKNEVRMSGSLEDLDQGYNVWVDLIDPDESELNKLAEKFHLNKEAIQTCINKSKKPEVRQLDNHTFTVIVDMKNKIQRPYLLNQCIFSWVKIG